MRLPFHWESHFNNVWTVPFRKLQTKSQTYEGGCGQGCEQNSEPNRLVQPYLRIELPASWGEKSVCISSTSVLVQKSKWGSLVTSKHTWNQRVRQIPRSCIPSAGNWSQRLRWHGEQCQPDLPYWKQSHSLPHCKANYQETMQIYNQGILGNV